MPASFRHITPHREPRCENCQIHVNRDVHLDITSLKARYAPDDITQHTYIVHFADRTATEVRRFGRRAPADPVL